MIAGANVTVVHTNTGTSVATKSNEAGRFIVPLLMPGDYSVTVDFPGFRKEVRDGVVLLTGDPQH